MTTLVEIPTLTTKRLTLRAPRLSDLAAYAAFRASERSRTVGGPFDPTSTMTSLCAIIGHWHLRGFGRWLVADRATDAPLGVVGPFYPEEWPEPEIAWSVFEPAEGKGIAYEAAHAALTFAYQTLGWSTAISCGMSGNERSFALAKRLGARPDGVFDHPSYGRLEIYRHAGPEVFQ